MKQKVEFIESYIKVGNDYQWHDNHGELIRCKDCKYAKPIDSEWLECQHDKRVMKPSGFCSWAEPKDSTAEVRKQLKDMEQRKEMERKK